MKFFLKTLGKTVLWVVLALLLFLVISGIVQQSAKTKSTGLFGVGYAVVVSGSMVPALNIDDMIFYHAHSDGLYEVGDVIVYESERPEGRILITHRIVRFEGSNVVTLGDANHGHEDQPFPKEQIVGKVVFSIPGAGKFVTFMGTTAGILTAVAVMAVLLALNFILSSGSFRRRKTKTVSGEDWIRY